VRLSDLGLSIVGVVAYTQLWGRLFLGF